MNAEPKYDFYCEEVLSGKTAVEKLYESDRVIAFYHTKPSYAVHIVITTKKHILDLAHLADDDLPTITELLSVARDLSKNLDLTQGVRLITNLGKFQDTPHIHFHLVVGDKVVSN